MSESFAGMCSHLRLLKNRFSGQPLHWLLLFIYHNTIKIISFSINVIFMNTVNCCIEGLITVIKHLRCITSAWYLNTNSTLYTHHLYRRQLKNKGSRRGSFNLKNRVPRNSGDILSIRILTYIWKDYLFDLSSFLIEASVCQRFCLKLINWAVH